MGLWSTKSLPLQKLCSCVVASGEGVTGMMDIGGFLFFLIWNVGRKSSRQFFKLV
jgi:hypothetical protein